tara:strand:- start:245 stop:493 length:249 start_codon:yes stop_codon:yes gene_type:complete
VNQRKKRAVKEAIVDTFLGTLIMFPLNFIIVYICLELLSFNAIQITIATTATLFFVAVWRKATVRLYYEKKYDARRNTESLE